MSARDGSLDLIKGEYHEATHGRVHVDIPDARCDAALLTIERKPLATTARVVDETPCALLPDHDGDHVSPDGRERWKNEDEENDQ